MSLWRISNYADLSGLGGLKYPARWHNKGRPIVYTAEHPALAMLEILVHTDRSTLPDSYRLLEIEIGRGATMAEAFGLKTDWKTDEAHTREIGDKWLADQKSVLMKVPSAIVPNSFNILINPAHPDMDRIKIIRSDFHALDDRLK
jgi:RES domain-containing protein